MTDTKLTNTERESHLLGLLDNNTAICTGDQMFIMSGGGEMKPLGLFVRKNDNKEDVFFATPTGLILFKANKLHKAAQKKAVATFLENLDKALSYESSKNTLQ